jgi:hypothetical protein
MRRFEPRDGDVVEIRLLGHAATREKFAGEIAQIYPEAFSLRVVGQMGMGKLNATVLVRGRLTRELFSRTAGVSGLEKFTLLGYPAPEMVMRSGAVIAITGSRHVRVTTVRNQRVFIETLDSEDAFYSPVRVQARASEEGARVSGPLTAQHWAEPKTRPEAGSVLHHDVNALATALAAVAIQFGAGTSAREGRSGGENETPEQKSYAYDQRRHGVIDAFARKFF